MNFEYKETIDKQRELVSLQKKVVSKSLVSALKVFLYIMCLAIVTGGFFGLGVIHGIIKSAPSVENISIVPSSYSTTVYDTNNKQIAKLITSGSNRIKADLKDIPEHLRWAFIDTEDARFYEHNGIDIQGIGRAAFIALTTLNPSEGASTITQQVLKNNVFTSWTEEDSLTSSLKRKIQEQYLAVQLEKVTKKDVILETYLNTINLGSNTLGVKAASLRYFNKDVSKITVSEAGVIAAITQNPSLYNPITNPDENAKRRKRILTNMKDAGHITQEQYDEAMSDNVYARIKKVNNKLTKSDDQVYSYFVDEVVKQVLSDLQEQKGYTYTQAYNAVYSGGLKIYTTQDSDIQKICDKELSDSANYPYAIKYSINWAWTVQNPDGTVDNYDESDIDSRVELKDNGAFNIHDYMYVKDFLYELSWEGSYINELKENEFTNEVEEVYKYLPREIVSVIYEKVANVMEERKEKLYKEFKKRYNEDFLFNSVRWYKRTRDGKVYYDMNLEELSSDKKVALEEKIKVEIGNGFKTRWGSPVTSKVAPLEDNLLLDIYDKGCELLGIENQYSTEVVKADNSYDEEKLTELMIENCKIAANLTKGINRLKVKVVNSIDKRLDDLINMNVYKTKEHMELYLENARTMVFGYYKSINLPGFKRNLIGKEEKINKIINKNCR